MKKLRILTFVLLLLSLHSCKPWSGASDECKTFLKGLQSDWSYDTESKIFRINSQDGRRNQGFLAWIDDHMDCLKGLPGKKIRRVLGEPSRIDGSRWKYYLVASCLTDEFDNCDFLDVVVDAEKGLQSIRLSGQDLQE